MWSSTGRGPFRAFADIRYTWPMPVAGRLLAGRYRLISVIGAGGMGEVWEALDLTLQRPVAVKEVRLPADLPDPDRDMLHKRMMREALLTARLNHPGIITIHDVVSVDGRPYIVMELLPSHSLAEEIDLYGPLPTKKVAKIGLQLLDALGVAHRSGIIHRDVKPSNVLLGDDGRVVLTDFGIATSSTDGSLTTAGLVVGSPTYMSPERLRGEGIGPATDMWSLGATLYAALEGHPPFQATSALGTITAVLVDELRAPSSQGPLHDALVGMLEKDPSQRSTQAQARPLLQRASGSAISGSVGSDSHTAVEIPAGAVDPTSAVAADWQHGGSTSHSRGRRSAMPLAMALLLVALVAVVGVVGWLLVTQQRPETGESANATDKTTPSNSPTGPTNTNTGTSPTGTNSTGTASTGATTSAPSGAPSTPPPPPPFQSVALYDFERGLFRPENCFRPQPGVFPFLEQVADEETVHCVDATYEAHLFRSASLAKLRQERSLFASNAVPGSVREIVRPRTGSASPAAGRQFLFAHENDGFARIYWDSVNCLCGGVLQAPDVDTAAALRFWRRGP